MRFDHNHKIICCYFALHVVASCMTPKLKWSKLQEYLSLHRLLDTFPNTIVGENKGVYHGGVRLERHAIMSYQYPIPTHVGHVQLQQYGFRARLIFPSYFRLFLLRALLDQSTTSRKQKAKKPSVTQHTICGNNYLLCREMSMQTKQVE